MEFLFSLTMTSTSFGSVPKNNDDDLFDMLALCLFWMCFTFCRAAATINDAAISFHVNIDMNTFCFFTIVLRFRNFGYTSLNKRIDVFPVVCKDDAGVFSRASNLNVLESPFSCSFRVGNVFPVLTLIFIAVENCKKLVSTFVLFEDFDSGSPSDFSSSHIDLLIAFLKLFNNLKATSLVLIFLFVSCLLVKRGIGVVCLYPYVG